MKPILNNPNQFPSSEVLLSVMTENFQNYKQLLSFFEEQNLSIEWHYYNDGKSWLCKIQHKKKTVCWLSVWENCFKLTFYFTEKHLEDIAKLEISKKIKEDFFCMKQIGRLFPMIITVDENLNTLQSDIATIVLYKMKYK